MVLGRSSLHLCTMSQVLDPVTTAQECARDVVKDILLSLKDGNCNNGNKSIDVSAIIYEIATDRFKTKRNVRLTTMFKKAYGIFETEQEILDVRNHKSVEVSHRFFGSRYSIADDTYMIRLETMRNTCNTLVNYVQSLCNALPELTGFHVMSVNGETVLVVPPKDDTQESNLLLRPIHKVRKQAKPRQTPTGNGTGNGNANPTNTDDLFLLGYSLTKDLTKRYQNLKNRDKSIHDATARSIESKKLVEMLTSKLQKSRNDGEFLLWTRKNVFNLNV